MRTPRPTISFVILVAVAAIASYGALTLTGKLNNQLSDESSVAPMTPRKSIPSDKPAGQPVEAEEEPKAAVSATTGWKDYTDNTHFLSFKYPPQWSVKTYPNRSGYYIITIKPDTSFDNIRIYVSPDDYFGMAGLPTKKDTLAGTTALNVNDMLIGVKYAAQYYTFDIGNNIAIQPQFQQILKTVAFSK